MKRIALLGSVLVLGSTLAACGPRYGGYGGASGYDPYSSYAAPSYYPTPYDTTYAYGSGYQSYRPQPYYYALPVHAQPRHHNGGPRHCRDGSWCDRDDNPPGPRGGPGTNWENPPGPAGGPGASPNRRQWSHRDRDDDDRRGDRRRRW